MAVKDWEFLDKTKALVKHGENGSGCISSSNYSTIINGRSTGKIKK